MSRRFLWPLLALLGALIVALLSSGDASDEEGRHDTVSLIASESGVGAGELSALRADARRVEVGENVEEDVIAGRIRFAKREQGALAQQARVSIVEVGGFGALAMGMEEFDASSRAAESDGSFLFRSLDPGKFFRISAWAPGHALFRTAPLRPGRSVEVSLSPALLVTGTVVDSVGNAAGGVKVTLRNMRKDGVPGPTETDMHGAFSFESPGPGKYDLSAVGAGGTVQLEGIELKEGMQPLRLVLGGDLSVTARVRGPDGLPLVGAHVVVERAVASGQGKDHFQLVARARGEAAVAKFFDIPTGAWLCRASHPGLGVATRRVHVTNSPGGVEVSLQLLPAASLKAKVVDDAGGAVSEFPVNLHEDPGEFKEGFPVVRGAVTDADGFVRWDDLPPGSFLLAPPAASGRPDYRVVGIDRDHEKGHPHGEKEDERRTDSRSPLASTLRVQLQAGELREVQWALSGHTRMSVRVLRAGQPVVGAPLTLVRQDPGRRGTWSELPFHVPETGQQGESLLPPWRPGVATLQIDAGGFPAVFDVTVRSGGDWENLELPLGSLVGRIDGAEAPLDSVRINVALEASRGIAPRQSHEFFPNKDGAFGIIDLARGRYSVEITSPGRVSWEMEQLNHDGAGPIDLGLIDLPQAGALVGQVLGIVPVEKGFFAIRLVRLIGLDGRVQGVRDLPGDGVFRFNQVPPGPYSLEVLIDGEVAINRMIEIPAGGDPLRLELQR